MRVRPVFIESKEPTQIIGWKGKLEYADDTKSQLMDEYYKLYLVSLTEEIAVGDYFICSDNTNYTHLLKCSGHTGTTHLKAKSDNQFGYGDWPVCYSRKVAVGHHQISVDDIKRFITEYNTYAESDIHIDANITTGFDVVTFNKGTAEEHIDHTDIDVLVPKLTDGVITVVEDVATVQEVDIIERHRKFITRNSPRIIHDELGELFTRQDVIDMITNKIDS